MVKMGIWVRHCVLTDFFLSSERTDTETLCNYCRIPQAKNVSVPSLHRITAELQLQASYSVRVSTALYVSPFVAHRESPSLLAAHAIPHVCNTY